MAPISVRPLASANHWDADGLVFGVRSLKPVEGFGLVGVSLNRSRLVERFGDQTTCQAQDGTSGYNRMLWMTSARRKAAYLPG